MEVIIRWVIIILLFISACDEVENPYPQGLPKQKTMSEIEYEIYGHPDNHRSWGELNE